METKNRWNYGLAPAVLWFFLLILAQPADAAVQWSLSVAEGFYHPSLDLLNYTLRNSLVELGPRKLDARPVAYPVIYQGDSPVMPEMEPKAPQFGLQVQADINPRYTLVFGESIGVLESRVRDTRKFFVGFFINSPRETRFSLSLNQVWFGVKRNFEVGPSSPSRPKHRFYGELGLVGITGAYLSTDVWLHVFSPEEGFDFYKVVSTGASGRGYATYLGGGGEFFFNSRISMGADLQYVVGGIKDLRYDRFFTVDPLEAGLIKPGEIVMMTDFKKGRLQPLFLSLDGWDIKGVLRFYF